MAVNISQQSYYELLGLSPTASVEEIKAAYRQQMKAHHPDQYAAQRSLYAHAKDWENLAAIDRKIHYAEELSKRLNLAYKTLIDPEQRRLYDLQTPEEQRRYRPQAQAPLAASPPRPLSTLGRGTLNLFFTVFVGLQALMLGLMLLITLILNASSPGSVTASRANSKEAPPPTRIPPAALIAQGEDFFAAGDYAAANEAYSAAIVAYDGDAPATLYYQRGLARKALLGQSAEITLARVLADFAQATSIDPEFVEAHLQRALLTHMRYQQSGSQTDGIIALNAFRQYLRHAEPASVPPSIYATLASLEAALQ